MSTLVSRLILLTLLTVAPAMAQQLYRRPLVGAVTDRSATVQAWLDAAGSLTLEYGTDPSLDGARSVGPLAASAAEDFVVRFTLEGLEPSTRYYYRVGGALQSFTTMPAIGTDAPMEILFGSCQQRNSTDSGVVFRAANDGDDLFIQLGDWTYPDRRITDFPTAAGSIRESYAQRYDTTYPFARTVLSRMGAAYVWDDHDYWKNNADGSLAADLKDSVITGYRRYFPHYPLPNPNGIWQSFRAGNVEFFLIDSRSQRNPIDNAFPNNRFEPPAGHSMLAGYPISGTDQRTWLADAIRRSTARWQVLVTPVFFNPGAQQIIALADLIGRSDVSREVADKWVGYPADIDTMRTLLREGYGRNMLIISGDAHVNVYDDGTRSLRPEFMVGNLDITTADLFALLSQYNITLWSAMQSGLNNTIGRLRVETTPVHRLVVESYDEEGAVELRYEMADSTGGSGVRGLPEAASLGVWTGIEDRTLRVRLARAPAAPVRIELFDVSGRTVLGGVGARVPSSQGGDMVEIDLPHSIVAGTYLGRITVGDDVMSFRVVVGE